MLKLKSATKNRLRFLGILIFSTLAGVYLPGKWSLIYNVEIGMTAPVYLGDELKASGKVIEKDDAYKMLTLKLQIRNQKGKKVSKGKMRVIKTERFDSNNPLFDVGTIRQY